MILTPQEFRQQRYEFVSRSGSAVARAERFKNLTDTLVPGWFEWHPWSERILNGMVTYRWIAEPGCSSSGKTHNTTGVACGWWAMAPHESSVIFCTTSLKMLKKRAWPVVQSFYDAIEQSQGEPLGNMINSQTVWQSKQGDDKHAIFGIAVEQGDANKVAAHIQGIHTKRQMVVVDESEAMPEAIWKVTSNLYSYPIDAGGEFVFICIGNPRSRLSRFGRFMEPEHGWNSVTIDHDEWESKPQLDGKRALVIRFDFRKSPNITENRSVSRHLPSKQRVEGKLNALRLRGGENDPDHYAFDLGFPPPEGLTKTVFTASLLEKHGAYGRHQFTGTNWRIIGAFDYAGGGAEGNRPAVRFAAIGEIGDNMWGIELMEPTAIYTDATDKDPAMYQLLKKLKDLCNNVMFRGQRQKCEPENFAIDCTGTGTGMGDIAQREWDRRVIRILFSGSASEEPVSKEDDRIAKDVWKNKRVEMYFRAKTATMSNQVAGMDKETAAELCSLEYNEDGPRIVIESKKDYIERMHVSPDYADVTVMLFEVAMLKGFYVASMGLTRENEVDAERERAKAQSVYTEADHAVPEDDGFVEGLGHGEEHVFR